MAQVITLLVKLPLQSHSWLTFKANFETRALYWSNMHQSIVADRTYEVNGVLRGSAKLSLLSRKESSCSWIERIVCWPFSIHH